jgi:colanic acid/amylovoran biosynthesis protein
VDKSFGLSTVAAEGAGAIKIVVTNQVALNTGDGAILIGLVNVLKRAFGDDVEIVVLDPYGSAPQRYYPELRFKPAYSRRSLPARAFGRLDIWKLQPRILQWLASRSIDRLLPRVLSDNLREFRTADLVISAGGTYLVEHYRLELNLLQLGLAVSTGTPTVMFTQSLGPFSNAAIKAWIQSLFPKMAAILLRDRRSFLNLEQVGVPTANVRIKPDAAFALADVKELTKKSGRPGRGPLRAAISVRSWSFPDHPAPHEAGRSYRASVSEMVTRLVRHHGAKVTFISTCQGVPEYRYDDSIVANEIVSSLADDVARSVAIDASFHRPEKLRDILNDFDLIIGTRMHVAILGLCAGTPVLPIAYEFKTKELFEGLGGGEWVLDIASMDPEQSVEVLDRFVAKLDEIRADLIPRVIEQQRGAIAVADELWRVAGPRERSSHAT